MNINTNKNANLNLSKWIKEFYDIDSPLIPLEKKVKKIKNSSIQKFILQDWSGEELLSSKAIKIQKIQNLLVKEAFSLLKNKRYLNKSRENLFHQKFIKYYNLNNKDNNDKKLDDYDTFWEHFVDPLSPYRENIDLFTNMYCFQSVTAYIYQVNFIKCYATNNNIILTDDHLLNSNSFISSIFPAGSSKEIKASCLNINLYNWYRPSKNLIKRIYELTKYLPSLSVYELYRISIPKLILKNNSFSLSHKMFGKFSNMLMIYFPQWFEQKNYHNNKDIQFILNTKISGQYSCSIGISHWAEQENNTHLKWNHIISPHFFNTDDPNCEYINICYEWYFLKMLFSVKPQNEISPISMICQAMNRKYKKDIQLSFIENKLQYNKYQRIFLNSKEKNALAIIKEISNEIELLSPGGFLYILCNYNILSYSLKDKLKDITYRSRLVSYFNFKELENKGELSDYVYIFKKRDIDYKIPKDSEKESCISFNFTGNLYSFSDFQKIDNELTNLFNSESPDNISIKQKKIDNYMQFNLHQDAIVEGSLISSINNHKIIHPSFMSSLSSNYRPLGNFFNLENIIIKDSKDNESTNHHINWINQSPTYAIIVDLENKININISVCTYKEMMKFREKYGDMLYKYFKLIPKKVNTDYKLLNEYFLSNLGNQLIQLTISDMPKIKSRLQSILIPEFIATNEPILKNPQISITKDINNLLENKLDDTAQSLIECFTIITNDINSIAKREPQAISIFCDIKEKLLNIKTTLGGKKLNFNNKYLIKKLLDLELLSISINNPEVYIEKINDDMTITTFNKIKTENCNYSLEFITENQQIAMKIHSNELLLSFIEFLCLNLQKQSPEFYAQQIYQLEVPKLKDLELVIKKWQEMFNKIDKLFNICQDNIDNFFNNYLR